MLRVGGWLLLHADSLFYLQLGHTPGEINARVRALLGSPDPGDWGAFANAFVDRLNYAGAAVEAQSRLLLGTLGGERIVHGHTPVHLLLAENEQNLRATAAAPGGGTCRAGPAARSGRAGSGTAGRCGSARSPGCAWRLRAPRSSPRRVPAPLRAAALQRPRRGRGRDRLRRAVPRPVRRDRGPPRAGADPRRRGRAGPVQGVIRHTPVANSRVGEPALGECRGGPRLTWFVKVGTSEARTP